MIEVVEVSPDAQDDHPHEDETGNQEKGIGFPDALHQGMPARIRGGKRRQYKKRNKGYPREENAIVEEVGPEARVEGVIGQKGDHHAQQAQAHSAQEEYLVFGFKGKLIHQLSPVYSFQSISGHRCGCRCCYGRHRRPDARYCFQESLRWLPHPCPALQFHRRVPAEPWP